MIAARRATRFVAYRDTPIYRRVSHGAGWALVGDAGFHQGPISGLGMSHAFRDAERLAAAIDEWLSGTSSYRDAMDAYARDRDEWAVLFGDHIVASLQAWRLGGQAPSNWPIVQRWLERIRDQEAVRT